MTIEILMVIGFCLAAYSIVGNDVPQTLGTFISSNAHRPWWVLWLFISTILVVVLIYGWYASGVGDASYGRLETIPFPEGGVTWLYIVPPILLLFLTKYGIPVSTTFLVLTDFLACKFRLDDGEIDDGLCGGLCGCDYCLSFCDAPSREVFCENP